MSEVVRWIDYGEHPPEEHLKLFYHISNEVRVTPGNEGYRVKLVFKNEPKIDCSECLFNRRRYCLIYKKELKRRWIACWYFVDRTHDEVLARALEHLREEYNIEPGSESEPDEPKPKEEAKQKPNAMKENTQMEVKKSLEKGWKELNKMMAFKINTYEIILGTKEGKYARVTNRWPRAEVEQAIQEVDGTADVNQFQKLCSEHGLTIESTEVSYLIQVLGKSEYFGNCTLDQMGDGVVLVKE